MTETSMTILAPLSVHMTVTAMGLTSNLSLELFVGFELG